MYDQLTVVLLLLRCKLCHVLLQKFQHDMCKNGDPDTMYFDLFLSQLINFGEALLLLLLVRHILSHTLHFRLKSGKMGKVHRDLCFLNMID